MSDDEIRRQFDAVNETWDQAKIVWEIESIVDSQAQAPNAFTRAIDDPEGRLAPTLISNLNRENLLRNGFNVAIASDYGRKIGGVFIPDAGIVFYAKRGPKGVQTPAVLAHELGHSLGLPHTIFEKDNNLMMGSGPGRIPTRVKPLTASQILIARHWAKMGNPFKPRPVSPPAPMVPGGELKVFEILDTNGDDVFTVSEVEEKHKLFAVDFMRKASRAPTDTISREEFQTIVLRQRASRRRAGGGGRAYGPEIVPQIFSRFDRNRDGNLTRQEASDPNSLVNEYFEQWDKDRDGVLTTAEVTTSLTDRPAVRGALRR